MRAYFKNDLYNFAAHDPRNKRQQPETNKYHNRNAETCRRGKKIAPTKLKKVSDHSKEGESSEPAQKKQIAVDDNLEITVNDQKIQPFEFDEDMLKSLSKKQNKPARNMFANNAKRKNNLVVKQEPKTAEKTEEEEKKEKISQYMYVKKLEMELKKISKGTWEQEKARKAEEAKREETKNGDANDAQNKNQSAGQPKLYNEQGKQDQLGAELKEIQKQIAQIQQNQKSKKPKTKNIKKQKNYVRLDLKRTYRDRFVGALNANLRYYGKNGRLKFKYRLPSELTLQDGQVYNTYISSLSSALTMTIQLEDSDKQGESSEIEAKEFKPIAPQIPSYYNRQTLTEYLKVAFGFESFRQGQYQTIMNILEGKSVVFVSQTASGKSLTYIVSSMLLGGLSIVVSPLVSLMLDQLTHLPPYFPAACISSLINRQQRDRIIKMVKNQTVRLLFVTPETLQTDFLYHLQDFPQLSFVCVDEAHCLSELSHNFRTSFLGLGQILTKQVKYRNKAPVILALTATANPETVASIQQRLSIDTLVRSESCMNKNLYITISKQKGGMKYESLIRYLQQPQISKCRGILVYTRTRKLMMEVFNYVTNSTSLRTAVYHSALSNKEKTETLTKFREGEIKVVVATVALGMGLDFANLQCVVHLNMPKSIENYVQEIGRAGRRQKRAYCHLFLDQNDYITQRNYIVADQLQKQTLVLLYQKLKEYSKTRVVKGETAPTKQEQAELTVRRAALLIQHKGMQEAIYEEEIEDDQQEQEEPAVAIGDCLRSKLFYMPIQKLTSFTKLREEALLTLLLKVESQMKKADVRLRVLPVSHQLVKLGFFKNNEEVIKKQSDFFRTLTAGCKRAKGTVYINLIDRCNRLGYRPIQLLTNLYRLGNTYMLKIELQSPIYLWQFEGRRRFTQEDEAEQLVTRAFDRLYQDDQLQTTLSVINGIQKISLVKLNTFYTLGFLSARNNMNSIITKKEIIPEHKPIPSNSIAKQFDEYFKTGLSEYYNQITDNQNEIYIPTTMVDEKQKEEIYGCIVLFMKQEYNFDQVRGDLERNRVRCDIFSKYEDGKVIARILMGVNSGEVSWQIYGERSYWMRFKTKNYQELLETVREQLALYKSYELKRL